LPQIKAVVTDFIGTLTNARFYTMEASMAKLHAWLSEAGFNADEKQFMEAYAKAHEKYRLIRYGELQEVTNAVWVAETLCNLGFKVEADDPRMRAALNVFFKDYVDSLESRQFAKELLGKAKENYKLGLISNFTYAPVVHCSLRKLGLSRFFNVVLVSGDCGWRKPHSNIFTNILKRLQVEAQETIYIGDCPSEDIKGARQAGMRTVFVQSQFYSISDLQASKEKPDFVMKDLEEIYRNFSKIVKC
jgi:putative hydrolase of the HAD superfamily